MRRPLAFGLVAAITLLANLDTASAQARTRRRDSFFTRTSAAVASSQVEPVSPAPRESAPATEPAPRRAAFVSAPRPRPVVGARPINWRVRYGLGLAYPPLAVGQYSQPAPINAQAANPRTPAASPMYDPQTTTGAPAAPLGPAPGYKYSYAGRFPGAYAYSSAYNQGYYTSGCYGVNACCRATRRYCTPFGGMFRGCGPGCYIAQVPPCPTNCLPGPAAMVNPSAPPAYGTPTRVPANAPPTPAATPPSPAPANPPEPAPPQPVEKRVSPAPQAQVFPRFPAFPPDA